jgi:hypothetical protein
MAPALILLLVALSALAGGPGFGCAGALRVRPGATRAFHPMPLPFPRRASPIAQQRTLSAVSRRPLGALLGAPALLEASAGLRLRASARGDDEGHEDPYERYFHRTWKGEPTETEHSPVHSHKWLSTYEGTMVAERRQMQNFIRGAPAHTQDSSYVRACPNFPYCDGEVPPPSPMVPEPWNMPAPDPNPIMPSLAHPRYPLPWELQDRVDFLSRLDKKEREKLVKERGKIKLKAAETLAKFVGKQGAIPNPERLSYVQRPLDPSSGRLWQQSFLSGQEAGSKCMGCVKKRAKGGLNKIFSV